MLQGPLGGLLATLAFGVTVGFSGGFLFLLIPTVVFFLRERRVKIDSEVLVHDAAVQLGKIATAGTMWAAAGLMALFYIAPGISTAVFYRQQDLLHLDTPRIGFLNGIEGAFGIVSAFAYAFLTRKFNLRTMLFGCLTFATITTLIYSQYNSYHEAMVVEALYGMGYALAECALMDLAIRGTPKGSEGLGFSLMMSVRNFALYGTDILGSWMMDKYHISFPALVFSNAATTAVAVPLVALLPLAMVAYKDAVAPSNLPISKTVEE